MKFKIGKQKFDLPAHTKTLQIKYDSKGTDVEEMALEFWETEPDIHEVDSETRVVGFQGSNPRDEDDECQD